MPAPVISLWTGATFKRSFVRAAGADAQQARFAKTWAEQHKTRLLAYMLLAAYRDNAGRMWLSGGLASTDELAQTTGQRREFGDAALLVQSMTSALLGDTQRPMVTGAQNADDVAAQAAQVWVDQWALDERLLAKMNSAEADAVALGDTVYALDPDYAKMRPRLRTYDPGFYFPELGDNDSEFPDRVHFAWEREDVLPSGVKVTKVRRVTYELVTVAARKYAYKPETSYKACLMTDVEWLLSDLPTGVPIEHMPLGKAVIHVAADGQLRDRLDIGLDFIPVIHVPNSWTNEHFGKSSLMLVLQIIDDLAATDTDLSLAAGTTGFPVIALSGTRMSETDSLTYGPGKVWQVGENGALHALDMSHSLDALLKYLQQLLGRLSVNARVPEAMLGRVNPGDVPSGLALALGFAPLTSNIRELRFTRAAKHPLILKFAYNTARAMGVALPDWPGGVIELGPFLPSDMKEAIDAIVSLLDRKMISKTTALKIVKAIGVDIGSIPDELERLLSEDLPGMKIVHDTMGLDAAKAYLAGDAAWADRGVGPPAAQPITGLGVTGSGSQPPPAPQ